MEEGYVCKGSSDEVDLSGIENLETLNGRSEEYGRSGVFSRSEVGVSGMRRKVT